MSDDTIIHFNPWRDFNDAPIQDDEPDLHPDADQIAIFMDVVFGYCDGFIPVRGFIDKGQGQDGRPHTIWLEADGDTPARMKTFAAWAAREGTAVYVIPGTVAETGRARAEDVRQMQTLVVDLDTGDIQAKAAHLTAHLGAPTLVVESGGRTAEGQAKLHLWWRLTEPAEGADLARLCRLRGEIAVKVGGDTHFRSAHQPIRVAGTVYHKGGVRRLVSIRRHDAGREVDLEEIIEAAEAMPAMAGIRPPPEGSADKPWLADVLTTPAHASGEDAWTRFQGASAAIGHFIRMVHGGQMTPNAGWEGICQYNAAMLRPPWPLDRLRQEADRLWALHVARNGPPLLMIETAPLTAVPAFPLADLLDDTSPMPEDIIAPRVLTPGGMLVLGGAPKVGKSDFLISLLVHMAAGAAFLSFTPPRPLRVFYLQAEIQYHYLRERLQGLRVGPEVLSAARHRLVVTPKLRLLLNEAGLAQTIEAVHVAFPDAPPDILCLDPIRNLFDGGPEEGGENANAAMLFFLQNRVEALRDAVAPEAGVVLCHHTRKMTKKQLAEDPFQALAGASTLRSFYTSGIIMHRPDEDRPERRLEIELRNGPAMAPMMIDKVKGRWVEVNPMNERLSRRDEGARHDAERMRKNDVVLGLLHDEARKGRIYTVTQFAEAFENTAGLGGQSVIRDRIGVLTTKGHVKFVRGEAATRIGLAAERSKYGYLCVEDMVLTTGNETVDSDTGEVQPETIQVLPSHYKCPQTGAVLPVENPFVWVYQEESD
ncbi:AAA family ATPase [Roseospira visakhapatnamensis]|uniref:AAA domain-containing protein n=1 Tax=Roseospira visakhapatnamensis TaxID=390880 RepID=A0A7W6RFY2_9PROT|nr:AAA family ATPase [Roseospira visakhapatnamensis]MBB4267615.1 hypothetical protein [Roseospira visakhapatnamensis]